MQDSELSQPTVYVRSPDSYQAGAWFRNFSLFGQSATRLRDPSLDIVRGVAILLAAGWHFNTLHAQNLVMRIMEFPGQKIGWAGVDLFFVLSGFLIGRGIFKEIESTGRFALGQFLTRRFFRLWPVLLLFLFVHVVEADRPWQSFLPQTLFCVQNYIPTTIPILWSLAVEEHFYLIIGLAFLLIPALARRQNLLIGALAAVLVLAPALRCLALEAHVSAKALQWQTQYRADSLAAGVLLAALLHFRPIWFNRLAEQNLALLAAVVAGSVALGDMRFQGQLMSTLGYTLSWFTAACFLLLLYGTRLGPQVRLAATPLIYCGLYAYPFYIWQFAGMGIGTALGRHLHLKHEIALQLLLNYGCAFTVAALITHFVEQPFIQLGKAFLRGGEKKAAQPAL
jgi:peptidoglycan/LPS O-acetylase OafA/YrhL